MNPNPLQKFGEVIFQHVVQPAKVPIETVRSHHEQWVSVQSEKEARMRKNEEEYQATHEGPRAHARTLYHQYVSAQTEAALRYQNAPKGPQKAAALEEFVRIVPPAELRASGVYSRDMVYTQQKPRALVEPSP